MARALAFGADLCGSARGMMLALGCIQALRCNSGHCPTGITTQNPALIHGLDVTDKAERVRRYHEATVKGFLELLAAMGLHDPGELGPHDIFRRVDDLNVRSLRDLYEFLEKGQLLHDDGVPGDRRDDWRAADPAQW